jgi:2-polyprenyl-3-methyl-5-hydroxy-6-metoxy-1,4-benzoquinol methylase
MIREEIILEAIDGKDVLDIGSIGQSGEYSLWALYASGSPRSLTGIDLPGAEESARADFGLDEIRLPSARDARIVRGDMETCRFDVLFDVVVAGDVLEHVRNQGLFLENIRRHLRPGGKLILTTPNAKWPTVILRPNPTHTLWHDRHTLRRILEISGFAVERLVFYCGNKRRYPLPKRLLALHQSILAIAAPR